MKIYLIGYMGCGKTTTGKRLANRLGYDFLDLDYQFEEKYKISVDNFFNKYDEHAFRVIESKLLKETINLHNTIISAGGGTPCFFDNMDFINKTGKSVYFKMSPKSLAVRLIHSKKKRPLVNKTEIETLEKQIEAKLSFREEFYKQADIIIKGEDLNLDELVNIVTGS